VQRAIGVNAANASISECGGSKLLRPATVIAGVRRRQAG